MKMIEQFNLSDKISDEHLDYDEVLSVFVVKEFIKRLKEEFKGYGDYEDDIVNFIDKLAGDKLIDFTEEKNDN